jgi:hypothetical protein
MANATADHVPVDRIPTSAVLAFNSEGALGFARQYLTEWAAQEGELTREQAAAELAAIWSRLVRGTNGRDGIIGHNKLGKEFLAALA